MSAICGYVGKGDARVVQLMLDAVAYRGDRSDIVTEDGVGIGYRFWHGRPGKGSGVVRLAGNAGLAVVAGSFAPPVASPPVALPDLLADAVRLAALDGNFAAVHWDKAARRLSLLRDPFGVRGLLYTEHAGTFYFASELKQLLAIPGLAIAVDPVAIHKYLTFSFVPGDAVPIKGIKRLLPGRIATWAGGRLDIQPYFTLREAIDPALEDQTHAVRLVRETTREAVRRRLNGENEVGLFLSGGIDSSAIAVWLKEAGVKVRAFTLDFGRHSIEKEQAALVARHLDIPLTHVPVAGEDIDRIMTELVWKLDLPFGDAVTGPLFLLAKAAREAGLTCVFNGEGGDQLFGGWTSKPMVAAELYAGVVADEARDTRVERYLEAYHRFYGLEDLLYTPAFKDLVGTPGVRRAVLQPYLETDHAATFLNRIRLTDISLKGSQNILPRMDRTAQCWGLDVRTPLFDRALAEASFRLPPQMKLHGATEKWALKLSLQKKLPDDIIWRRKYGMGVPIREWTLGPLARRLDDLIGPAALARRGWFQSGYVGELRQGRDTPDEIRGRRVGERLWALAMLEAWLRVYIDGRGVKPEGVA